MTVIIDCDLDARPATVAAPASRGRLPWVIAGAATAAAGALLALLIAQPAPIHAIGMARPLPQPEPTILADGSHPVKPTLWHDKAGQLVAAMDAVTPYGAEDVWCLLVVGDRTVEVHASGGNPAVCVWNRDAA